MSIRPEQVKFTPEGLAQADYWASECGMKSAMATAQAEALKESGKDLLAAIMSRLAEGLEKPAESKLERLARTSVEWQDFREGQLEANREAIMARQSAHNAERHWATIQSGISYKKAEIGRLSG